MKNSGIILIFIVFFLVGGYMVVYDNVIPDKSNKIDQEVEFAIITPPASNQNLVFTKNKVFPLKFKWDKRCLAVSKTTNKRTPASVGPRWPSGFV